MTPYTLARSVYDAEPCARTFEVDLIAHLALGYVVSTPEVFAMFRPVHRDGGEGIVDPFVSFPDPDCWHIYLAAGDISLIHGFIPHPLPWVSWERKNRLRFHRYRIGGVPWISAAPITPPTSSAPTVG